MHTTDNNEFLVTNKPGACILRITNKLLSSIGLHPAKQSIHQSFQLLNFTKCCSQLRSYHPVSDNFPQCPAVLLQRHVPGVSQIHCCANSLQRYQSTASDVKAQSAMYQFTVAQIHSSDVKAQLAMSKHNLRCLTYQFTLPMSKHN